MNVSFVDLQRQYQGIKMEIEETLQRLLKDQYWVLGNELKSFESSFAQYLGCKYVVGVDNGSDGLILALKALNIGRGDEVITPVNSFTSTTFAITEVGAKPVFTDVDPDTHQIDAKQVESKIGKDTKAILPVHLYGAPCDMEALEKLSKTHGIPIIEDACQAAGSTFKGKKLGTMGRMGVFSFYPGKNLGCYGNGGAICTNDKTIYDYLIKARNFGQPQKYHHDFVGMNSKLDDIQAAILSVKLKHLDHWNEKRRYIADKYQKELRDFKMPTILKNGIPNRHLLVIESDTRDDLLHHLIEKGIQAHIHYPIPIHLQKCYSYLGYRKGDFPVAERIASRIISLPIFAEMENQEVEFITKTIKELKVLFDSKITITHSVSKNKKANLVSLKV